MTFSYNSPPETPKDEVRFWSTDTVQSVFSVSDEDITYLLGQLDGNVIEAAAVVADRIADYWSSSSTASGGAVKIGPFSVEGDRSGADLEASWRALARRLRSGSSDGSVVFGSAGLFTGSKDPEFTVGMMDNGYQRFPERSRDRRPENGVW